MFKRLWARIRSWLPLFSASFVPWKSTEWMTGGWYIRLQVSWLHCTFVFYITRESRPRPYKPEQWTTYEPAVSTQDDSRSAFVKATGSLYEDMAQATLDDYRAEAYMLQRELEDPDLTDAQWQVAMEDLRWLRDEILRLERETRDSLFQGKVTQ